TRATGEDCECVTVTFALPLLSPLAAVIVAVPVATPVTSPLAETVATAVSELDQLTARSFSTLPPASFTSAASWTVVPAGTLASAGDTVTEPTGTALTVTLAEAVMLPDLAVTVAVPVATPRTTPELLKVAAAVIAEHHATLARAIACPAASD